MPKKDTLFSSAAGWTVARKLSRGLWADFETHADSKIGCWNRKELLFVDNCASTSKGTSSLRNVRVEFLLANMAKCLQPLDADVITNVKHHYKKCVIHHFLAEVERESIATSSRYSMPCTTLRRHEKVLRRQWSRAASRSMAFVALAV